MPSILIFRRGLRLAERGLANNTVVVILYIIASILYFSGPLIQGRLPGPFEFLQIFPAFQVEFAQTTGNEAQSDIVDNVSLAIYIRHYLEQGEIPFWNSQVGLGQPTFLNGFLIGHFTPINFVAMTTLPLEYFFIITACAKMVLFSFFLYKLMQLYGVDNGIAFIVGLLLMVSSYFTGWVVTVIGDTYSAIPWLFFTLTRAIQAPSRRTRLWLLLSLCYILLTGFYPVMFYTGLVGGVYALILWGRRFFSWQPISLILVAASALAITHIPLYYALDFLTRTGAEGRAGRGQAFAETPTSTYPFFPNLLGTWEMDAEIRPIFFPNGYMELTETHNFFSLFFALLVILNLVYIIALPAHRRNPLVIFWTIVQVWTFAMVYNLFNILQPFSRIPLFDLNVNVRLLTFFTLSSGILAGLTLQTALHRPRRNNQLEWIALSVALLLVILILTIYNEVLALSGLVRAHVISQTLLLALTGLGLLFILRTRRTAIRQVGLALITLVNLANVIHLNSDFNGTYTTRTFYPNTPTTSMLQSGLQSEPGARFYGMSWSSGIANYNLAYQFSSFQIYGYKSDAYTKLYRQINPDFVPAQQGRLDRDVFPMFEHNELLDFLNIKFIMFSAYYVPTILSEEPSTTGLSSAATTNGYNVTLFQNGFYLLENLDRPYTTNPPGDTCDQTMIYSYFYENNRIAFETNFCEQRTFNLPIQDYPGWSLTAASSPDIRLPERNNLMTFTIPPGPQSVEMRFVPAHLNILLGITALGVIMGAVVVWFGPKTPPPNP